MGDGRGLQEDKVGQQENLAFGNENSLPLKQCNLVLRKHPIYIMTVLISEDYEPDLSVLPFRFSQLQINTQFIKKNQL